MRHFFHQKNKKQITPFKPASRRRPLYVPILIPEKHIPRFLPDIAGALYPSELQCRNGIAGILKSTYDSVVNAFAPDYEKNIAVRLAEYYSTGIEQYFYGIHTTMNLYFDALGKQKDSARISTLVKESRQELLFRFQQLLIKRADLYKLYPLDAYVDLALFCETIRNPEHSDASNVLCQPQPVQYKVVSITEPWNRLQQTKLKMLEDFTIKAHKIYKNYMFEIECRLSSSAAPAPEYADDKELEDFQNTLVKYLKKHRKYKLAV